MKSQNKQKFIIHLDDESIKRALMIGDGDLNKGIINSLRRFKYYKTEPIESRFDKQYIPVTESGCWLWIGALDKEGYGVFGINGKQKRAHRVSYEAHIGKIPDGLCLDHKCRVRCCVNPSHLEAVTNKENIRRGDTGKHKRKTSQSVS
jgi:hypothetical protein